MGAIKQVMITLDAQKPPDAPLGFWLRSSSPQSATWDENDFKAHSGHLPAAEIQRVVRGHYGEFRRCYEVGLAKNPQLTGQVSTHFVITETGTVGDAKRADDAFPDRQVSDCIVHAIARMKFPEPSEGMVTVEYPVMLAPSQ